MNENRHFRATCGCTYSRYSAVLTMNDVPAFGLVDVRRSRCACSVAPAPEIVRSRVPPTRTFCVPIFTARISRVPSRNSESLMATVRIPARLAPTPSHRTPTST